jgi:hypothetical protein
MALTRIKSENFVSNSIGADRLSSSGDNPIISSVVVTDSNYSNTENSTISTSGGYVKIYGFNFQAGCQVHIEDYSLAASVTFVNSNEVRSQLPPKSAGSYFLYLTNPTGKFTIKFNGITYA